MLVQCTTTKNQQNITYTTEGKRIIFAPAKTSMNLSSTSQVLITPLGGVPTEYTIVFSKILTAQ